MPVRGFWVLEIEAMGEYSIHEGERDKEEGGYARNMGVVSLACFVEIAQLVREFSPNRANAFADFHDLLRSGGLA